MKTLDTKSLILGACATLLIISLTSSKTTETSNNLETVGYPGGLGVFNKDTRMLYLYQYRISGLSNKPEHTYFVASDGSNL